MRSRAFTNLKTRHDDEEGETSRWLSPSSSYSFAGDGDLCRYNECIQCEDKSKCGKCGWCPTVEAKRKRAIRRKRGTLFPND